MLVLYQKDPLINLGVEPLFALAWWHSAMLGFFGKISLLRRLG